MRYRLDVVAATVAEAVENAGGWLFDRVTAGWDVTVLIADCDEDDRPLQILGVHAEDLESAFIEGMTRPHPQTVAVAAHLFDTDARVRRGVLAALAAGQTEVTLWGEACPAELHGIDTVHHELSAAAMAFKSRALAACGIRRAVNSVETFRIGMMASVAADLVPAS
ncbi:hypothetical protein BOO86_26300 [Mycobacterium sp. CBMA 234]|uniref:hypothetical protein n=1 Tax=Mycolicibacterium sp. CBMA 234 TaxID=1918495 RepID=UPI0012DDB00B|nr:hypothetical protein [Mycolicibacterium sp. CBMA 234]MUL68010.1 hypothetical protein [Mycolicibacterium sp. CBMA 234]